MAHPDRPDPDEAVAARRRLVLVTAVGAVLAAALLFAVVARAMSTRSTTESGGDSARVSTFDVGRATDRAATIARNGPILFPDPRGGTLDIYVQHLGDKDWVAFEARAGGAPRRCVLRWEQGARQFVDPCDGRIFPADGTGLVTFPTEVNDKGRLIVDLSRPSTSPSP